MLLTDGDFLWKNVLVAKYVESVGVDPDIALIIVV
jgi:hypothetical protein